MLRLTFAGVALRLSSGPFAGLPLLRRFQLYACPPRLRQANRDRLLSGTRAVLALTNVFHLLPDKLARLRRRSFSFARVLAGALYGSLFGHEPKSSQASALHAACRSVQVFYAQHVCGLICSMTGNIYILRNASCAALNPHIPCTLAPGGVDEEHRNTCFKGVR